MSHLEQYLASCVLEFTSRSERKFRWFWNHRFLRLGRSWSFRNHMFLYTSRTSKFPKNASLFTDSLQTSGWKFLCPELAVVIHFESIWSHLGTHFGDHFGTRSAQDEPRWAQENHQELQSTENRHVQKTWKTICFSRFLGLQGRPRQPLKTQEGSQEAILGFLEPS